MSDNKTDNSIFIEIGHQDGPLTRHVHRFSHTPVCIGRGFANDLILRDAFVSPAHLSITPAADGDGWMVADMSSDNGVLINHKTRSGQTSRVRSGDEIVIGKTRLRVFASDHPVRPAQKLDAKNPTLDKLCQRATSLPLFMLTLGFVSFIDYLEFWDSEKLLFLAFGLIFLLWAAVWGLAGKILRHRARFHGHLSVISLFTAAFFLIGYPLNYLMYFTNDAMASEVARQVVLFVMIGTLLYTHLTLASPSQKARRWKLAWSSVLCLYIGVGAVLYIAKDDFTRSPEYSFQLFPFNGFAPVESPDAFLARTVDLFAPDA